MFLPNFLFICLLLCPIAALVFCCVRLKRMNQITVFDFLTVALPFIVWWLLAIFGWKVKSLSNIIEFLSLLVLVPLVLWLRVVWKWSSSNNFKALMSLAVCLLCALALYAFVPALPE